jgi:hypothetical protein
MNQLGLPPAPGPKRYSQIERGISFLCKKDIAEEDFELTEEVPMRGGKVEICGLSLIRNYIPTQTQEQALYASLIQTQKKQERHIEILDAAIFLDQGHDDLLSLLRDHDVRAQLYDAWCEVRTISRVHIHLSGQRSRCSPETCNTTVIRVCCD